MSTTSINIHGNISRARAGTRNGTNWVTIYAGDADVSYFFDTYSEAIDFADGINAAIRNNAAREVA